MTMILSTTSVRERLQNSMIRKSLKSLVHRATSYWIYKSRYLPIGADLKIDITYRAGHRAVHTVFDVGANSGQTYEVFREKFPDAFIHCFEPVATTFAMLEKRIGGDPRAHPEHAALGEAAGEKTVRLFDDTTDLNSLRDDLMNDAPGAREELIRIDTVDNYCGARGIDRIDLLKIDTEGYELEVLRGATKYLTEARISFLLCEVGFTSANTRNTNFGALAEFLAARRYSFFGLYDVTHYWSAGISFGNALFVHDPIVGK